jgi:D-glycero-D-manno-heptose 1,7-bisphosphate phosphatase
MNSVKFLSDNPYLFLDRDGVINYRITGGYVTCWEEFEFLPGVLDAMALLSQEFKRIVVVTNQQGVGKGLMSRSDLEDIHAGMIREIEMAGGRVDAVYYCTDLENEAGNCRKPGSAMGWMAKEKFPEIEFGKSIMAGDSVSDMEFGKNLGMIRVLIGSGRESEADTCFDCSFDSLYDFALDLHKG